MTQQRIDHAYLDMDGVTVDFTRAALELHGLTKALQLWPRGLYDMPTACQMGATAFWGPINDQPPEWWAGMPATPWADEVARLAGQWPITIASVAITPAANLGKIEWLTHRYGNPPPPYEFVPRTEHLPRPGGYKAGHFLDHKPDEERASLLLIDDSDAEVAAWRTSGGQAILFPAVWNTAHRFAVDPIRYVADELTDYA